MSKYPSTDTSYVQKPSDQLIIRSKSTLACTECSMFPNLSILSYLGVSKMLLAASALFLLLGDKKNTPVAISNGKVVVNEELKQELEEAAQDTSKGYQQIRQSGAVAGVGAAVDNDTNACSELIKLISISDYEFECPKAATNIDWKYSLDQQTIRKIRQ